VVIGIEQASLPMEGSLPPDLQGTLFRIGPRSPWALGSGALAGAADGHGPAGPDDGEEAGEPEGAGGPPIGALHAVEFRDGQAVSYRWIESDADADVFWHAGSVLALHETGLPSQYSRFLEPQEFSGGLSVPIASHVHRVAADESRVLFSVDDRGAGDEADLSDGAPEGVWLRLGEWDAGGGLRGAQAVQLERATWQHDVAVTSGHVVFIESPTTRLGEPDAPGPAVPFTWVPGAEGWLGVVPRGGDGTGVRWFPLDPCLVTHVLGGWEDEASGEIVLYVCRYDALEAGRPFDPAQSVVGPRGVGLAVLERWRVIGDRLERAQVDDRSVEYPRLDALLEGAAFRYGYSVELEWEDVSTPADAWRGAGLERHTVLERSCVPFGLLKFDLVREDVVAWHPGAGRRPSEPLFVRAADGRADDEGWLLSVVDDANRGTSDVYVLDASTMGRHGPEAIIHLPVRLPLRSHGEWVPADRYR
jgi:carotenoid cleavage dioxygenase-like enzyme